MTPARLFVVGGLEIHSAEGTAQGDPISMPIYALGILPLMTSLINVTNGGIKQAAFADDLTGVGSLDLLNEWWDAVVSIGPFLGYYPEPSKSWLVVKPSYLEMAKELFSYSDIKITSEGRKHLGAVIGTTEYKLCYVNEQIDIWVKEILKLSEIALIEPHAAYSACIYLWLQT